MTTSLIINLNSRIMISTKIHGYMDYLMGILLIALPSLFNLPQGAASTVPVVLGAGTIVYSLMTRYELGLFRVISVKTHIIIDIIAGLFLIATPWLFGFADLVYLPFVILGILEVGAASLTDKRSPYTETSRA